MTDSAEIACAAFDWQPGEHAEVVSILQRAALHTPKWRAAKWVGGVFLIGTLGTLLYQSFYRGDATLLLSALPWIIFVLFWVYIFRFLRGRNVAQVARNHDVHYPIIHRFTDQGLDIEMASSRLQLKWSGMTRVREEEGFFMFYWNPQCAYYTPKRALSIEAQNELRTVANEKLGADARVGPMLSSPTSR